MRKIYSLTIALVIIINAKAQWVAQTSGTTQNLRCVYFVGKDTGYAGGDAVATATLLKTTNGGITWTSLTNPSTYSIKSIWFVTVDTGYFINDNTQLYYTTNGGNTWVFKRSLGYYSTGFLNLNPNILRFVNRNIGFYTYSNKLFRTLNGGVTWDSTTLASGGVCGYVSFISLSIGYLAFYTGPVYQTLNGGTTWSALTQPTTNYLLDTKFLNSNLGFVVGLLSGYILKTNDGGNTWSAISTGTSLTGNKLTFTSTAKAFLLMNAGGSPTPIEMSNDSGNTWSAMSIYPSSGQFNDIFMVNDSIGYAVGSLGNIYKTFPGAVAPPNSASSSLYTNSISNTSMNLNWTSGNGARRIVIARANNSSLSNPTNGISYVANSVFGLGNTVGSGNYVVYDGTGSSCSVTGLSLNTTYFFRIYEYNGAGASAMYYTTAYGSIGATTLPVTLTAFTATKLTENKVQLNWSTASEINNKKFEIQRTENEKLEWQNIGSVEGNGTTNSLQNYQLNDDISTSLNRANTVYYRLKQIDFDGRFEYSKVVSVNLNSVEQTVSIYPNPNNGSFTVNFNALVGEKEIDVYTIQGKLIYQFSTSNSEMEIGRINSKGIYFLRIQTANGIQNSKIIIQ